MTASPRSSRTKGKATTTFTKTLTALGLFILAGPNTWMLKAARDSVSLLDSLLYRHESTGRERGYSEQRNRTAAPAYISTKEWIKRGTGLCSATVYCRVLLQCSSRFSHYNWITQIDLQPIWTYGQKERSSEKRHDCS
ncbi:hypothetical protein LSAT2_031547 [Lamellibrachia satsuma]|nr:hypothetical protein LSAT2_031547 [Lamellibrachia satsuma]